MSRKVYVSSDMSVDERLVEVSEEDGQSALLWPWILTAFDDWGRSEANTKRLKAQVFPMVDIVTPDIIERALQLFAKAGLIFLYEIEEKRYMSVPHEKWFKYQTHIRKEKRTEDKSRYPSELHASARDVTQVREDARGCAEVREVSDDCIPSPSSLHLPPFHPSPSIKSGGGEKTPGQEINDYFQQTFSRLPNPTQLDNLIHYTTLGMDIELVKQAIYKSRLKGKDITYAIGILEKQHDRGICTVQQAEEEDTQRQVAVGGESSGGYQRNPRTTPKEPLNKYRQDKPGAY